MGPTYSKKNERRYTYYHCEKDAKRSVSECPVKRVSAGDIDKVILEQLSAIFRTPTLVAKTYFAAKKISDSERMRLEKQKAKIEADLQAARQKALALMRPGSCGPDTPQKLSTVNEEVVSLSQGLTELNEKLSTFKSISLTESEITEAFTDIDSFWQELFPAEKNRLIRLLVDRIEIRESGIDVEINSSGLATLIAELTGAVGEENERKSA
jgi:site-specific DNA recombinase